MTSAVSPGEPRPPRADLSLRQVGESYKDYASRMAGWARAAEIDRDSLREAFTRARDEIRDEEERGAALVAELDRLRVQRDPAEVLRLAAAAHDIRPLLDEDDPRSDLAVVLDRLGLLGEQRDAVLALHVRGKDRVFHGPTVVPTCKCGASWPCETRRAMGATE